MTRYRVRTSPQDGRPEVQTVDAQSVDEALLKIDADNAEVLSIEVADPEPLSYEPAGEPPPSPPRPLPNDLTSLSGLANPYLIGGAIFTLVALGFIIGGLASFVTTREPGALLFALFPVIHLMIGLFLLKKWWRTRHVRRHLSQHGVSATATIDRVGLDTSVRVNRRHPNKIEWTYYIADRPFHGKRSSFAHELTRFDEGDRIWIVYDPSDPQNSMEWPPL